MQRWVPAIITLLAGVAVAGCIGDAEDLNTNAEDEVAKVTSWVLNATGAPVDPALFGGELPNFTTISPTDRISGEPTIGVTRSGAIFYAAIDFDVDVAGQASLPSTWYMRSTDGGQTWENASPQIAGVATHPTSFDPYVYVDPTTGRVFAMDMGPHVACNKVSWSDDDGATWMTRDGACIPGANDHPTLFAGPATPFTNTAVYPNHLYLCVNQISDSLCYNSPDGGINWIAGAPAYLGYDAMRGLCGGLHGHGHASFADGTIYLGRDWCGEVSVAVSHDGGLSFERVVISDDEYHQQDGEHDVSIATDASGTAYALWIGDEDRSVFLSTSADQGATWSEPVNVTAPGVTAAKLPSLVAGDDGRIAFLYIGSDNEFGWAVDDRVPGCDDARDPECYEHPDAMANATWNAYVGYSLNAGSEEPVFATVLANDPETNPLKRGGCFDRCIGNKGGGFYDFLDIDMDPTTGQVYLALVDTCNGDCDVPGTSFFDVDEKSIGLVGIQSAGVFLLEEEIAERTTLV